MLVGIVSDTHDNLALVEWAVAQFEQADVDVVIHCGDFVAPFSASPFEGDWDFYAVRGNNDGEWALQSVVEGFGTYLGQCGRLTLDDTDIAVYHGTNKHLREALVRSGEYDFVFHGHTHQRAHEATDGTVRVNPGGLPVPDADDTFSVATLDTASGEIEFHERG